MKKFRSSYNRVIYLTCFALILIASAIQGGQYIRERENKITELQTKIDQFASNLDVRAEATQQYVEGLKGAAEQYLYYVQNYEMVSPLWRHLTEVPDKGIFILSPKDSDKAHLGNLGGLGSLKGLPKEKIDEIHMALLINPGFRVAFESTSGVLWIYYTSAQGFQNLYPWLPASKPEYYKNVLNTQWFQDAGPERNPNRLNFWSAPYVDGMVKGSRYQRGAVVSNISPVYAGDKFLGTISMDISLKEFTGLLTNFIIPTGTLGIFTTEGELLAARKSSPSEESIHSILQTKLGAKIQDQLRRNATGHFETPDHFVYMRKLKTAPWVVTYIGEPRLMFELDVIHALEDIMIIALCLIFVVGVGYFVVTRDFISPAQKLLTHIEKENRGELSRPQDLPELWAEWFEIVTKIFSENRSLMDDLESRVKLRTQQLQKKNRKLEKALDDLKRAQDQIVLQEKMASLGALTAGIAHEIKNPLHFIINFTDVSRETLEEIKTHLSKDDAQEIELIEQNLTKVLEHAHRADSIVKGMLSHARGGDGKFEYSDLNKLLTDAVDLAYAGFCGKEKTFPLHIQTDLDMNLPHVKVSSPDLSRVFLNIANNACFAMHEKLQHQQDGYDPTLKLRTELDENSILITIEDNGTGIPKSVMKKIFHPFFTTKETGKGTGLGMSMSYEILTQQHQGEMWIESELDKYARFYIKLPC